MPRKVVDVDRLQIVRDMLIGIGEDPDREGLKETPARVVRAWAELFCGYKEDPMDHAKKFEEGFDQMIVLRGAEFFSFCEHHMLPFYGTVSIGYVADGKVIGLSKLARIADCFARRLQIQERMTKQIATAVMEAIQPKGVAVVVEGVHTCMTMRGVNKQRATMSTSEMLGLFRDNSAARHEVLSLMRSKADHG